MPRISFVIIDEIVVLNCEHYKKEQTVNFIAIKVVNSSVLFLVDLEATFEGIDQVKATSFLDSLVYS